MDASIPIGALLGHRWRVVAHLGSGGFGQVYRCTDESSIGIGDAAIKVLHPNTSPAERQDFLVEVQKIASLRHQNLVGYLDSGIHMHDDEAHPYVVTELCESSLADRLSARRSPLSPAETVGVLRDVSAGLAHLHERSQVHRDVKAGNVLFADGSWKLADFGLMRDMSQSGIYRRQDLLRGTPLYMAPELFVTNQTTAASDMYAVGVLAHMCAAGKPLHTGTPAALTHAVASQPPTVDPSIHPELQRLVWWLTAADPGTRPSALQLHQHLRSLDLTGAAIEPPPSATSDATLTTSDVPSVSPHSRGFSDTAPKRKLLATMVLAAIALVAGGLLLMNRGVERTTVDATGQILTTNDTSSGGTDPTRESQPAAPTPTPVQARATPTSETRDLPAPTATVSTNDRGASAIDDVDGNDDDQVEQMPDEHAALTVDEQMNSFDEAPCADRLTGSELLTNRFSVHTDYVIEVEFFDSNGVRVDSTRETVQALAPSAQSFVDLHSTEEAAVSCTLTTLDATATPPTFVDDIELAKLVECADDGTWHRITVEVANPTDQRRDFEIYVAVVGTDGIRLDEDWAGIRVYDIPAGGASLEDSSQVFWHLDDLERPTHTCHIVAVDRSW